MLFACHSHPNFDLTCRFSVLLRRGGTRAKFQPKLAGARNGGSQTLGCAGMREPPHAYGGGRAAEVYDYVLGWCVGVNAYAGVFAVRKACQRHTHACASACTQYAAVCQAHTHEEKHPQRAKACRSHPLPPTQKHPKSHPVKYIYTATHREYIYLVAQSLCAHRHPTRRRRLMYKCCALTHTDTHTPNHDDACARVCAVMFLSGI